MQKIGAPLKAKLEKFASLHSGMLFPRGFNVDPRSPYSALQLKDVLNDSTLTLPEYRVEVPASPSPEQLLRPGDVVLKSKGQPVATFIGEAPGNIIPSSSFFLVRTRDSSVLPEYLAWYLNQRAAQGFFLKNAQGTSMKTINLKTLAALPVAVPTLQQQRALLGLDRLTRRYKAQLAELQKKADEALHAVTHQILSLDPQAQEP